MKVVNLIFYFVFLFHSFALGLGRGFDEKPNIVLILADDLTWSDVEPYGNPDVKTPNIQELADQGMTFDGMYTATAMCAPTRQQLYTGLYPVRSGAYPNHSWVYDGVKSLPHYLKPLGYRIGISGKHHFGPPDSYPFREVGGQNEVNIPAINKFITEDTNQPFALVVASDQPHKPWSKGDPEIYDPEQLQVPSYLVNTPTTRKRLAKYYAEVTYLDQQVGKVLDILEKSGKSKNTLVIFTTEQGAQFPFAKWTLYENGIKTGFIARWPDKIPANTENEALVQYVDVVPTLVEIAGGNPQQAETGRKDALGNEGFDGESFLPVLLGEKKQFRDYVYGVHTTLGILNATEMYPIRSVRNGRYKYIKNLNSEAEFSNLTKRIDTNIRQNEKYFDPYLMDAWFAAGRSNPNIARRAEFYYRRPRIELYDLQKDPFELNNLAGNPHYNQIVKQLDRQLNKWMTQQGDKGLQTEFEAMSRSGRLISNQQHNRD